MSAAVRIAPSLLSADFARLADALAIAEEGGADLVHLDVMDGHFVPNLTIGPPVIRALRKVTRLPFDCHLMISNPQQFIPEFLDAGADMISVHIEADPHIHRALSMIRQGGAKAGVAVNPGTASGAVDDLLEHCDFVLVMTVNPGFGGQKFIGEGVRKIERLRNTLVERRLAVDIEVDGGIDPTNASRVVRAGASILVAGSAVFGQPDPAVAIRTLRNAATNVLV